MSDAYDASSLNGRKLVQIGLTTRDPERAKRFYSDVLGLKLMFEAGGMMFFDLAGLRLMIGPQHAPNQVPGGSIIYFDAPDIDALGAALEKKGVVFPGPSQIVQRTETHDLKLREFSDPDGNTLALMGMVQR
jgi:predicted enzyme related to lactoylglutathione lyase